MKIIQTERLIIKPLLESDKPDMLELLYDSEIKKTYMIPEFESVEAAERLFYAFMRLSNSSERFVGGIYFEGKLIGFLNDTEISEKTIEMGYVISPEYKNRGFCTEAFGGVINYLFVNGFDEVVCGAFEENIASIRVMQKCNMKLRDKTDEIEYRGKTHRCIYYSITK